MIPSLNMSVGLTVIGPAGSRLTAAPESSRRTAASCTQDVGESTGAAGAFPADGFNTSLITVARMVKRLGGGGVALGVVGCTVTSAFGVTTALFAVGTDDSVDTVVAVVDTAARGVDTNALAEGVLTATWLGATLLLGPVAVWEGLGEFAPALADLDDDRPRPDVLCVGASSDCPAPAVPALPDVLELFSAPPVLTTTPGEADVVAPVDVEAAVDPDPVDVGVLVEDPVEVFADPEPVDEPVVLEVLVAPPVPEPLADEPDEFEEAGWAHASP